MNKVVDRVRGKITDYDERRGVVIIEAPYDDFELMCRREYKEVEITMLDSRPLSEKQRRCCYAMLRAIAEWSGYEPEEIKDEMKFSFIRSMLDDMDMFSLKNAPMSTVAAFQTYLARFIVAHGVPTKRPVLDYVDDVGAYLYACTMKKKCAICGKKADLHHVHAIGAGRNRDEIVHEGLEVLPLCRLHHTEIHTIGRQSFMERYHIPKGIIADKEICKKYGLKGVKNETDL